MSRKQQYTSHYRNAYRDLHQPALVIAASFVLIALLLSTVLILQHLRSYTNPAEQMWIVAVLFMVPVYASESILSLWKPRFSLACDILRNCYEAFALYSFGSYLIACLGNPYIAVVLNFSQMWALYCLVQFYKVTHEILQPIKPLAKFISFKAIVFATWWQGVGIALLCAFRVLPKEERLQTGLQDFLICIEMAIAAVAHVFVFPVKPYQILQPSTYGEVSTQTTRANLKLEKGDEEKPALYEKTETEVKAPGTSVRESVQDIVVEGGQHVVKDVVLTIHQAIEPVEKGMTMIQETFHQVSVDDREKDAEVS